MKKLGLLIASVFVLSAFSATAQNYEELLQQAQQYEAQKKWVHALGTYWDAMEIGSEEPFEKLKSVAVAYDKLRSTLAKGNPGYGEFDEFDMYSNWIALLKEFEQYWSENTPVYFSFGEIKKGDLDFSTRTASYSVFVTLEETQKYVSITNTVKGGLKTAKKQDWKGIPEAWPVYSIYTDDKPGKNKDGVLLALLDSRRLSGIRPASLFCITPIPYEHCNPTMYEVTFSITDETGKELLKSDRHIIYEGSSGDKNDPEWYTFNGVPQDVMKVIDAGHARIALTGVYLKYGFVRSVGYIVNDRWTFDKSPERQEDVSKIRFEQKEFIPVQNMDARAMVEQRERQHIAEEARQEREAKEAEQRERNQRERERRIAEEEERARIEAEERSAQIAECLAHPEKGIPAKYAEELVKKLPEKATVKILGDSFPDFSDKPKLKIILEIPEGTKEIKKGVLSRLGAGNLITVIIPTSVKYIQYDVFDKFPMLKTVYYRGSEDQWRNGISIFSNYYFSDSIKATGQKEYSLMGRAALHLGKAKVIYNYKGK